MDGLQLKRLSKQLSRLLRHQGDSLGVDPEGFVAVDAVLRHLPPGVTIDDVQAVIATVEPHKQRFTLIDGFIRANYGHSLASVVAYARATPPPTLYHGTSSGALAAILATGLQPMRRQFVHLTVAPALARQIGQRHGPAVVLAVDAVGADAAGVVFHHPNDGFWLVRHLPPQFLRHPD